GSIAGVGPVLFRRARYDLGTLGIQPYRQCRIHASACDGLRLGSAGARFPRLRVVRPKKSTRDLKEAKRGMTPNPPAGLRAVALFEAAKGTLVLVAGFGLFRLLHRDADVAADLLSRRLHLNPAKHHARVFLDLLYNLSSSKLWMLAALALTYSCVRFIEAYGLWHNRTW